MNEDNDMITLRISRRDVGRLLVGVRERKRKFQKGLAKFADNFDAEKGVNIKEGFDAYKALEKKLTRLGDPHAEDNRTRRPRCNPS